MYWHIFHSSGFHHICNIRCRLDCRYSPQNIFNAKNFNPHKKLISLLNVPICTQGLQRPWWPEARTIIVTGPYWVTAVPHPAINIIIHTGDTNDVGSVNGLSPVQNQAMNLILAIIPYETYLNGVLIWNSKFYWRKYFKNCHLGNVSQIISASMCKRSILYVAVSHRNGIHLVPVEWHKTMLESTHCHHRIGLEVSAKALMLLSQIPPEWACSGCTPFNTSRTSLYT